MNRSTKDTSVGVKKEKDILSQSTKVQITSFLCFYTRSVLMKAMASSGVLNSFSVQLFVTRRRAGYSSPKRIPGISRSRR